jgi:tellurite resistance-related uncharacterized protein
MPAGLRHRHQTRSGVWGLISVVEGRLRLHRLDPLDDVILESDCAAVVAPEEPHKVEALGTVRFFVEFYRVPDTSAA